MKNLILSMCMVVFSTMGFGQECWNPDIDDDGFIGMNDLLSLLAYFGDSIPDFNCEVIDACNNETDLTYNGYTYDLVSIGSQCWFAENLRTEFYSDGTVIPYILNNSTWGSYNADAMCYFEHSESSLENFGVLYNWYAVNDSRSLCPVGWHVPSDDEWMVLEMELGMSESDANSQSFRGTDQGTQMKSSPTDDPYWDGTNSSGWSGLPGESRLDDGSFFSSGLGVWWTSSDLSTNAWYRWMMEFSPQIGRANESKRLGLSVRCIKG